ncbi:MAG: dihydroneopterin aldolase [Leptolyngbyaceae cyanobacterium bins.302]|nr:dihydroneopterin aldolase [Leptolyngbyaceae cyanobacterium bins.302]
MDVIRLTGIRGYGYTGALPEEQVLGQWFEVDVSLWLDLTVPGQSDRLSDTVDYGIVVQTVQQMVKTARFALLERLATAIAESILDAPQTSPVSINQVRVAVTKLTAPIPDFDGKVTIELIRSRQTEAPLS